MQGTVVLVFQPAEEGGGGAKKMLDEGALESVEAIFGLHVAPYITLGEVASRPGPLLAGSGCFQAVISGKGGHAAIPQHTIDPRVAASSVVVSLQHLISREADPLDSQVSVLIFLLSLLLSKQGKCWNVDIDSVLLKISGKIFQFLSFVGLHENQINYEGTC